MGLYIHDAELVLLYYALQTFITLETVIYISAPKKLFEAGYASSWTKAMTSHLLRHIRFDNTLLIAFKMLPWHP